MSAHPMLHGGDFYNGSLCDRERRHKRVIREKCAATLVTATELAETVDHAGNVDMRRAERLVRTLLGRAHDEAVGRTLGILPAPDQPA